MKILLIVIVSLLALATLCAAVFPCMLSSMISREEEEVARRGWK